MSDNKQKEKQIPYNFGRVFFPKQTEEKFLLEQSKEKKFLPEKIRFQPLGNHVGNMRILLKHWDKNDLPCQDESFQRILESINIHDMAKPLKFKIMQEPEFKDDLNREKTKKSGKKSIKKIAFNEEFESTADQDKGTNFQKYIYSFKSHRFFAKSKKSLWAQYLAIGHHSFSVQDICKAVCELKGKDYQDIFTEESYSNILSRDALIYAKELYILEMCDQIEAELACRVLDDDEQAESRNFMDFIISQSDQEKDTYLIDPWIFSVDAISLDFKYWSFSTEEHWEQLEKCYKKGNDLGKELDKIVKQWWNDQARFLTTEKRQILIKPYSQDKEIQAKDCKKFYQQLAKFSPNPMQEELFNLIPACEEIKNNQSPPVAILLKSPTGSGKMEAIVFASLAKGYNLILPLPAKSLIEDQKQRIENYLKSISSWPEYKDREFSLVVDTGSQMYRWVYQKGEIKKSHQNQRRHLYKGDIILTTLDKFLYRYFAFGGDQKSFTFPLRINRPQTLICFDEAHSYENVAFTNFQNLVKSLYEAGRSLILMTATMPKELVKSIDYLDTIDFVDDPSKVNLLREFQRKNLQGKYINQKSWLWRDDLENDQDNQEKFIENFAQIIFDKWKKQPDTKIIAVIESVKNAVAVYQLVKGKTKLNTDLKSEKRSLFLYHGRIADQVRPDVYQRIQKRDTENLPYIIITTSAIEVGCDLDSQLLISEICPPENLIQRAGRCNRKGKYSQAEIIVVGNKIPDYVNTLSPVAWENYQSVLKGLKNFDTEKILSCIEHQQEVNDYRVVELFSMLHEYVYEADLTCQPLHERGLIPTRSWTPAVTLQFDFDDNAQTITVPIDRLCNGKQYSATFVYESRYDQEKTNKHLSPLKWGTAYSKDITVQIAPGHLSVIFDSLPTYNYNPELGFVELPKIFLKKWVDGPDVKLLYLSESQKVVITYINPDITSLQEIKDSKSSQ